MIIFCVTKLYILYLKSLLPWCYNGFVRITYKFFYVHISFIIVKKLECSTEESPLWMPLVHFERIFIFGWTTYMLYGFIMSLELLLIFLWPPYHGCNENIRMAIGCKYFNSLFSCFNRTYIRTLKILNCFLNKLSDRLSYG